MDIHDTLSQEHRELRSVIETLRSLQSATEERIDPALRRLKALIQTHFRKEELYYRVVDRDKRLNDRGFVHQLRNDHAALIFGMESLQLRLKKKGPVPEWWAHFEKLMGVFIPHMDHEEQTLFTSAEKLLTADEWAAIRRDMAALESAS